MICNNVAADFIPKILTPEDPRKFNSAQLCSAFIAAAEYAAGNRAFPFQYVAPYQYTSETRLETLFQRVSKGFLQFTGGTKRDSSPPVYILNIPFTPIATVKETQVKWERLTKIIREQSFGKSCEESQATVKTRLAVIFGMNKPISLDRQADVRFDQWLKKLNVEDLGFQCRVVATVWKPSLQWKGPLRIAQIANLVLEYLGENSKVKTCLATKDQKKVRRSNVPFPHIRQWIFDDTRSQKDLPELLNQRWTYLTIMDDDAKAFRFRNSQGLFSQYDQIVKLNSSTGPLPQLMSTGYFAAENESPHLQLSVIVDMCIRAFINYLAYFPEPNYAFLLNDDFIRKFSSFIKEHATKSELSLEGRRHLNSIRSRLDPERIVFNLFRSLATAFDRIGQKDELGIDPKDFTKEENLGRQEVLKGLVELGQSHAKSKYLAQHVFSALQGDLPDVLRDSEAKANSNTQSIFIERFTRLFKCFDMITFTTSHLKGIDQVYSHKHFRVALQVYELWTKNLYCAWHQILSDPVYKKGFEALSERTLVDVKEKVDQLVEGEKGSKETSFRVAAIQLGMAAVNAEETANKAVKKHKSADEALDQLQEGADKLYTWAYNKAFEMQDRKKTAENKKRKNKQEIEAVTRCSTIAWELSDKTEAASNCIDQAQETNEWSICIQEITKAAGHVKEAKTVADSAATVTNLDKCTDKVKKWAKSSQAQKLNTKWGANVPEFMARVKKAEEAVTEEDRAMSHYQKAVQGFEKCVKEAGKVSSKKEIEDLIKIARVAQPSARRIRDVSLDKQMQERIATIGGKAAKEWADHVRIVTKDKSAMGLTTDYEAVFQAQLENICKVMQWAQEQNISAEVAQKLLVAALMAGQGIFFALKANCERQETQSVPMPRNDGKTFVNNKVNIPLVLT